MKNFFGKKSRSALALVLIVSLGLHLVAILIFGTIKFVESVMREEKVFEAAPVETPPQQEKEYQVNFEERTKSTPPPQPPAIVVNNPSELDIPALDIDVNVDASSVYGRPGGSFGGNPIDLKVLVGEAPGGVFGCALLYQKKGEDRLRVFSTKPLTNQEKRSLRKIKGFNEEWLR